MKTSKTKFILFFVLACFVFVFLYDVTILSTVRGRPESGTIFLNSTSLTGWRKTVSTILYPIKLILVGPMLFLLNLPDPPPPFVGIGMAIYWSILALIIRYLIGKIKGTPAN